MALRYASRAQVRKAAYTRNTRLLSSFDNAVSNTNGMRRVSVCVRMRTCVQVPLCNCQSVYLSVSLCMGMFFSVFEEWDFSCACLVVEKCVCVYVRPRQCAVGVYMCVTTRFCDEVFCRCLLEACICAVLCVVSVVFWWRRASASHRRLCMKAITLKTSEFEDVIQTWTDFLSFRGARAQASVPASSFYPTDDHLDRRQAAAKDLVCLVTYMCFIFILSVNTFIFVLIHVHPNLRPTTEHDG